MARMRSPNYPTMTLDDAIVAAKAIWDKNRKAQISREAVAKDLGYSGLTGRSLQVLGALNQYGLLEITAKGLMRVTQNAEDIFIGFPEDVKRKAVTAAARTPQLFREIYDKFDGHLPGENAIRSFLFQRGFTNDGVERALKNFVAANRHAEVHGVSESYGSEVEITSESNPDNERQGSNDMETQVKQPSASPAPPQSVDALFWHKGALDFNLSSSGLAVVGKTNSAQELKAFVEKLTALAALLPDEPPTEH